MRPALGTVLAWCIITLPRCVAPFTTSRQRWSVMQSTTAIKQAGLFEDVGNVLGGIFGGGGEKTNNGPKQVLKIPARQVKTGALRFMLQIHLVSQQNKPEPQSWFMQQGDDGRLNAYFKDGSGMLSFDLQEYGVKALRHGQQPSLQYVLQESILLHSVLDELHKIVFETEDIEESKRLIRLSDAKAIETARAQLPARAAL